MIDQLPTEEAFNLVDQRMLDRVCLWCGDQTRRYYYSDLFCSDYHQEKYFDWFRRKIPPIAQ